MENVNSCCYAAKVTEIKPIEGADKIELAIIGGWNCIIQKDTYKVDDLVIIATTDAVITKQLVANLGLESYLRKGNRVRTVKLKGIYSECLTIPFVYANISSKKKVEEGTDCMDILGIFKYEPPVKQIQLASGKKVRYQDNPNFHVYYKFPNLKNVPGMFTNEDTVEITRKIHGCFHSNTKIRMFDGSKKRISEIKKGDVVLSVDKNNNLVPSKVLNTFINGKTDTWLRIKTHRKGKNGNSFDTNFCTKVHKFYTKQDGYKEASKLSLKDTIFKPIKTLELTDIQKSILTGKLLGDGSIHKANINWSLVFGHKKEHIEYINETQKILGNIIIPTHRYRTSGYGTTMIDVKTRFLNSITSEFSSWYNKKGTKIVPSNIKLDEISLAYWYMDDGSLSHHDSQQDRANFAICGFDKKSSENLINALSIIGISGVLYKDTKNYYRIRLNKDDADKMFKMIAKYIPSVMQYKLPKKYQNKYKPLKEQVSKEVYVLVESEILEIKEVLSKDIQYSTKYDIETKQHNYFANDVLVHNCNARYGIVRKTKLSLWDKIKKFLHLSDIWSDYEFVVGSHNVEKGSDSQGYYDTNVWYEIANRYSIKEKLWNYVKATNNPEVIGEGIIIYGEIYGAGIQKGYDYGLNDIRFAGFDIKRNGEYLDIHLSKVLMASLLNLPYVEVLYHGKWSQEIQDGYTFNNFIKGTKVPEEGIVIKDESGDRRKIGKIINPDYLIFAEKHNVSDSH